MEMPSTTLAGYSPLPPMALDSLMEGYEAKQVAYLDLRKVRVKGSSNLINIGPNACLAGDLARVPGQLGAPSQVCSASLLRCGVLRQKDIHTNFGRWMAFLDQ
jgi:hypothetical protein